MAEDIALDLERIVISALMRSRVKIAWFSDQEWMEGRSAIKIKKVGWNGMEDGKITIQNKKSPKTAGTVIRGSWK